MARMPLAANFMLFIVLCASLAYWGKQSFAPQSHPVTQAAQPLAAPMPRADAGAGLFGGPPPGAPGASSFQLKGVIAAGPDGIAILFAQGKPAQVLGVGMQAAPGVTVSQVYATYVLLDEGGVIKRIDLPASAKGGVELIAAAPDGELRAPSRTPVMLADNGPPPIQRPAPANVYHGQTADGHIALRRPSGMGPPPTANAAPIQN